MNKSKALIFLALLLYLLSVSFQFSNKHVIANALKSTILPVVTLLYFISVKNKSLFFKLFLVLFSISELLVFLRPFSSSRFEYFLGNSLYMLAYVFLIAEVLKSISLNYIFKNYKIHLLVLTVLNGYIIYILQDMVNPYMEIMNEYYMELIYNIVMLLLLTVSLVNYFYRDNVKSLYMFLGSLCVVFAEVIWMAYTYISERYLLNLVSTTLYALAFYFFYSYARIEEDNNQKELNSYLN